MLRLSKVAVAVAALIACTGLAVAQFDVNGPNAALTIQNTVPSAANALNHQVNVAVPGDLDLDISGGANPPQGLILIAAPILTAGGYSVPWGGSIDCGTPNPPGPPLGIQVVVDSIFFTTNPSLSAFAVTPFSLSLSMPLGLAGQTGPGVQAIVADPTAPPFFLDNTEAGQPVFKALTVTVYNALGDDAFQGHALDQVNGPSPVNITYGGTVYTSLFVGTNGAVTFGSGSSTFSVSLARFFAGFQNPPTGVTRRGVGVAWQDMNPSGFVGTDDITVIEDRVANTVQVAYNNQEHWDSNLSSGSFSVTFGTLGAGSVYFDYTGFLGGDPAVDAGPIIGVTDGTSLSGTDRTSNLSADIAANYSSPGPQSIAEDFNAYLTGAGIGQPLDIGTFTALDATGTFTWVLF